ncbi:suppressor of mitotic defects protein [Cyclospora cayetanensis]|uniref:RNA exonuclease 4 n=1 Tax=Cyclospora cayetanensis TaxID=88456 RepID=A0A1D3CX43_9EIME|nr:suppressor of mitotic defects protein [Cyclospora cayetanensis]
MGNRKKRRGLGSVLSALKKTEASHLKRSVAESEIHSKEPSASQQPEIADLPEAVALDCEMVGCGDDGRISVLAQVALVNEKGETLVNELVKPQLPVTDLRAHITGLDLWSLENRGISFSAARSLIQSKIKGKILVGHAIHHDLQVLNLTHPLHLLRDTSKYRPLRPPFLRPLASPSLRLLVKYHLKRDIQTGKHDPAEDARETMNLYSLVREQWERRFAAAARDTAAAASASPEEEASAVPDEGASLLPLEGEEEGSRGGAQRSQQQRETPPPQLVLHRGARKKRKRREPHEYYLD